MLPIYVINLTKDKDRRIRCETQLKDMLENVHFVPAVDGNTLDPQCASLEWYDPNSHLHLTKGELGCAMSHYNIWQKIISENIPNAIILEDDFTVLDGNFLQKTAKVFELDSSIDFVYLGRKKISQHSEILHTQLSNEFENSTKIVKPVFSYWTIAYAISLKGAQKLAQDQFVKNITPVDEYVPYLMGTSPNKICQRLYGNLQDSKLNAVSFEKNLIKPIENAFECSNTFHSKPIEIFKKEHIQLITVATSNNDCVKRFVQSCKRFGFDPVILGLDSNWNGGNMAAGIGGGQKVNLLKKHLENINYDSSTLLVFTDSYDVIANDHLNTLLEKYKLKYYNKIVFGSETSCWPDTSLASKYPESENNRPNKFLNSGVFMGPAQEIKTLLSKATITDSEDDQLYYTKHFLFENKDSQIVLDYQNQLFMCMNNYNFWKINESNSSVECTYNSTRPNFIHGNGPPSIKRKLNEISNYCVAGWNSIYGYKCLHKLPQVLPRIILIFDNHHQQSQQCLQQITNIEYPKENIDIIYVKSSYHDYENNLDLKEYFGQSYNSFTIIENNNCNNKFSILFEICKAQSSPYVFYVTSNASITNTSVLKELIKENKSAVAPLLKRKTQLYSNFWGDIDSTNFYKRSFDYIDIAERNKKGCWNVPYIWHAVLISKQFFNERYFLKNQDKGDGIDMAFCYNMRLNNHHMFLLNTNHFGSYVDNWGMTLNSYEDDPDTWERMYINSNYKNTNNELCTNVHKVHMFTQKFCHDVIDAANNYPNGWSKGNDTHYDKRIGNVENHPTQDIHLHQINLDNMWKFVVNKYISPMIYDEYKYNTKDINISFVVKYDMSGQKELRPHHDSSTYTINICLNDNFESGGCHFIKQNYTVINKDIGSLIYHPGKLTHYHKAHPITSGTRFLLISFIN